MSDLLRALGYDPARAAELAQLGSSLTPGRVVRVDRGAVSVQTARGRLRLASRGDIAVGDWIAIDEATIAARLERRTRLVRRSGDHTRAAMADDVDVVAANIDLAIVVRALDMTLRTGRIQQLLTLAYESGAEPVVALTKADRAGDPEAERRSVEAVAMGVDVFVVSVVTGAGVNELQARIAGRTFVLIGESGAGKSTLVNTLAGASVLATADVRRDGAGRHTTTHRELVLLPGGSCVIDTPGVREAAFCGTRAGLQRAYADVEALARDCRFSDCKHRHEPGCAVAAAVAAGDLDAGRVSAWRRAVREEAFLASRTDRAARADTRARWRRMARERRRDAW